MKYGLELFDYPWSQTILVLKLTRTNDATERTDGT